MLQAIMARPPFDPAARGFHSVYRSGERNICPGCGRSVWIIGRFSAECACCATALALVDGLNERSRPMKIIRRGEGGGKVQ